MVLPAITYKPLPAFAGYSGAKRPRMLCIGKAWGNSEAESGGRPFAGESGKELFRMLGEAMPQVEPGLHAEIEGLFRYDLAWLGHRDRWFEAAGIGFTNVLALRPPGNKIEELCAPRAEMPADYPMPFLARAKYLRPEYLSELARLHAEINELRPNLLVALGNTACWALLHATNIDSIRGNTSLAAAPLVAKVLPTYHPAAMLRMWSWRPIIVADLMKASREAQFPELRRPRREILVNPTIDEVEGRVAALLANPPPWLSPDIETGAGQIKEIGFAWSRSEAFVVPFVDLARPGGNYWPTPELEWRAWQAVRVLLESPIPKVGQNFIYDLQYICRMGIRPVACRDDTMLLHHAHFPEMQKGLGFLGSIYTDEASWKLMRRRRPDTEKRDE